MLLGIRHYAALAFSFTAIAAVRTNVAACGDRGITVHLNGFGGLLKSRLILTSFEKICDLPRESS
jgi:hypothetical protein